ncbi:MAG: hypothetical protein NVSMB51_17150 [Solirubrobacteraceae bacterium]
MLLVASGAAAAPKAKLLWVSKSTAYPGLQHLHYEFGPIKINPGQNDILIKPDNLKPSVPGYITHFAPNLHRLDGSVPPVDVIHLHHGVWLVNGAPTFAAGEEKTQVNLPRGYGLRYKPSDTWLLNYMIHNLYPTPDAVYITYDVDFMPDSAPAAQAMKTVRTQWMDVQGIKAYPVFDVHRGTGRNGKFTYPTDAVNPYPDGRQRNKWIVDEDGTLVQTGGHLHPGGLYTDLWLTRGGRTVPLFRSFAHYFEPAGAVSWDVAMTTTPENWRVQLRKGDVLSVTGTYDTSRASWYESMAIMPVAFAAGDTTGKDPFRTKVNVPGPLTHGHLPENNNHGGVLDSGAPNPMRWASGPLAPIQLGITNFTYQQGDYSGKGAAHLPATVHQGQPITFINNDAGQNIYHTITACRQPCNRAIGVAYPLANGPVDFDSGELGFGPRGFTAAKNVNTWSTPANLQVGTYTYFCRIHPFMRGAFRVVR